MALTTAAAFSAALIIAQLWGAWVLYKSAHWMLALVIGLSSLLHAFAWYSDLSQA